MSEIFALSFDCQSSPVLKLNLDGEQNINGWGLGWYPNNENAATVIKDSGAKTLTS